VGSETVYADDAPMGFTFRWIGDGVMLVQREDEILLFEVDSGRLLARRRIPAGDGD
jgi:hypothetical protein